MHIGQNQHKVDIAFVATVSAQMEHNNYLTPISVQWVKAVYKMARFFRFSEVSREDLGIFTD